MSNARFDRFVLVWETGTYCSTHRYTAEEFNTEFDPVDRARLLEGYEVNGCVDLEAFYLRVAALDELARRGQEFDAS